MNLKKIVSLFLAVLMVLSFAITGTAAKATAEVNVNVETFTVTAKVTTTATGTMTAILRNKANTIFADSIFVDMAQTAQYTQKDGVNEYTFTFVMQPKQKSGDYVVTVGGNVQETACGFTFNNVQDIVDFYNTLDKTTAENDGIYNLIMGKTETVNPLYYDFSVYAALPEGLRAAADKEIEAWDLAATMETVATVDHNFTEKMNSLMTLAKIANSKTAADAWSSAVDAAIVAKDLDGAYYSKVKSETVRSFMDTKSITKLDTATVGKAFDAACLLAVAKELDYASLNDAFDHYLEKGVVNIDKEDYKDIQDEKLTDDFFKELKKQSSTSLDSFEDNFETVANETLSGGTDNGNGQGGSAIGSGSGSGSGGGGGIGSGSGSSNRGDGNYTFSGSAPGTVDKKEDTVYNTEFADLSNGHYAKAAVAELASRGVIAGRGDGNFYPDDTMTREEFVKLIIAAFHALNENAEANFADVAADRWSYRYIASAVENGLVNGTSDTTFSPDGIVTREDMAVILHRVCKRFGHNNTNTQNNFTDASDIADYAKDAVAHLSGDGIINGMGDGTFLPKAAVTRAQAAKTVYALLNLLEV